MMTYPEAIEAARARSRREQGARMNIWKRHGTDDYFVRPIYDDAPPLGDATLEMTVPDPVLENQATPDYRISLDPRDAEHFLPYTPLYRDIFSVPPLTPR